MRRWPQMSAFISPEQQPILSEVNHTIMPNSLISRLTDKWKSSHLNNLNSLCGGEGESYKKKECIKN